MTAPPLTACPLPYRGVLRVEGEDRAAFLQGLISNDIALCQIDRAIYAALLTPQGKFLHDLFLCNLGDAYLIDCEAERAEDLRQRLMTYKLRAKVSVINITDEFKVWAFATGTGALQDPRLPSLGTRGIFAKDKPPQNAANPDVPLYDRHRLSLGIADGSRDMIIGKSTLSDGNFDLLHGISWTKGCYVGQELTARMHHRALVKKRLLPVKIEGVAPASGTILSYNGSEIGEMRSSNGLIGVALLNLEQVKSLLRQNAWIDVEQARLTPCKPDWLNLSS